MHLRNSRCTYILNGKYKRIKYLSLTLTLIIRGTMLRLCIIYIIMIENDTFITTRRFGSMTPLWR